MIAARQIFLGRGGAKLPTASDYPYMPTLALYDGIENAGWGVHDFTTATWKDLVNGYDAVDAYKNQFGAWTVDGFEFTKSYAIANNNKASWFINSNFPISGVGSWTYECVCNASSDFMDGAARGIFGNMGSSSSQRGVCGFQKKDSSSLWHGTYDGGDLLALSSSALTFGDRQSLVLVSDANSGNYYVYVNGFLFSSSIGTRHSPNINGVQIGAAFGYVSGAMVGKEDGVGRRFVGTIHALRVSNRALTAAEVAANYAIDKARFNLQ